MQEQTDRGRFVWYELMTPDPQAARAFYRDVAGWGVQEYEGLDTPYAMWTLGETPVGGLMQLDAQMAAHGVPPNWLAYIATEDVDASAAEAERLGAKVQLPPMTVPGIGRMAVLTDPHGASFALYQSETPLGEEPSPETPGVFSWHELSTTDHGAAFDFYAKLFGWEKTEAVDMGPIGTYQMYGRTGRPIGGMYDGSRAGATPPSWLFYLTVADMDEALERVRRGGGRVTRGPDPVPGGSLIAHCIDPQGAAFALTANPKA